MEQYQINGRFQMRSNILSGAMYKLHLVAYTFCFCRLFCAVDHLRRKIAYNDLMPTLGHFDCGLPFSTASIQHTQFLWLALPARDLGDPFLTE